MPIQSRHSGLSSVSNAVHPRPELFHHVTEREIFYIEKIRVCFPGNNAEKLPQPQLGVFLPRGQYLVEDLDFVVVVGSTSLRDHPASRSFRGDTPNTAAIAT